MKTIENSNPSEYTNHSGGAKGSDSYWDIIGREFGVVNHKHYWYKKPNPLSKPEDEITKEQYEEGIQMIHIANKTLKRHNIEKYMYLLARNWMQVKNADTIFAIGQLKKNNHVEGGTGWACQMAIDNQKPLFVFNQKNNRWYKYDYNNFKFQEHLYTPRLTKNFAGIGTREITKNGIDAIRNVYRKTFN